MITDMRITLFLEHLFVSAILYGTVGVIMDRLLDPILNWSARRVGDHFERIGALLKDPPWRETAHGRIFFWPSTVALVVVGLGAAMGTKGKSRSEHLS